MAGERPKVAITKGRASAFLQCLVHIIPIGITMVVLSLNVRNHYYADVGTPRLNSKLEALQFAAKVHEGFIIASLTAVVLYHVRSDLVGGTGVPFSVLTAGYQIGQIRPLWRYELWAGLIMPGRLKRQLPLALTVILSLLLAAVSGPASAITMIPRLDWWMQRTVVNYVSIPTSNLWPTSLTSANAPSGCFHEAANRDISCPSAGFLTIMQSCLFGGISYVGHINVTFQQGDSTRTLAVEPVGAASINPDSGHDTIASDPYVFRASSLSQTMSDYLWEYWSQNQPLFAGLSDVSRNQVKISLFDGNITAYRPQVEVQCAQDNNYTTGEMAFPHDRLTVDPGRGATWKFDPRTVFKFNDTRLQNDTQFAWMDVSSGASRPSIGAAILVPDSYYGGNPTTKSVVVCTVDAWWVPVAMWLDPGLDNYTHQDSSFYDFTKPKHGNPPTHILIDSSWAQSLNIRPAGYSPTIIQDLFSAMLQNSTADFTPASEAPMMAFILSFLLTDGLARVANFEDSPFSSSQSKETPYNLYFNNFRLGYGYGLKGAVVKLAVVILLLHTLVALIHTFSIFGSGRGYKSWSTMEELLTLAMNSPPTMALNNTCAGIGDIETWKKIVKVREGTKPSDVGASAPRETPGHLVLTFEDRNASVGDKETSGGESGTAENGMLQPNTSYGTPRWNERVADQA
ncbi:hypothetical protein FGG08_003101 [Glutinoglossum americanum]|uniref:Uncharacterized protein n=1 Tax=Glutinoglossum americanum TaxID=1670608 RepID=A0A9P8I7Z3_9PEZI|nr:hypothetical protein FGG08_003101 [Glutinoglossum americanum]